MYYQILQGRKWNHDSLYTQMILAYNAMPEQKLPPIILLYNKSLIFYMTELPVLFYAV